MRAIGQLGELLGAVHSIAVDGFGYLRPDGRAWPITFESIMLDLVGRRARLLDAARHWAVAQRLVDAGLTALADHTYLYDYRDPRLVHGDFSLDHVLVDGDSVSGIIDMQECAGGHPACDIAYWIVNCDHVIPLAALLASYPGGTDFIDHNATLITLMTLRRAMWMLMVDQERGNPSRISDHVRTLDRALATL
jgi:aminoglycoside phosphotransferase (APT) family kinase protein